MLGWLCGGMGTRPPTRDTSLTLTPSALSECVLSCNMVVASQRMALVRAPAERGCLGLSLYTDGAKACFVTHQLRFSRGLPSQYRQVVAGTRQRVLQVRWSWATDRNSKNRLVSNRALR